MDTTAIPASVTFPSTADLLSAANRAHIGWRKFDAVSVRLPSQLFAHIRGGRIVGFGIEPVGDAIVERDGTVERTLDGAKGHLDRARMAVGAAVVGAVGVLSAAGGLLAVKLHRR